MEQEAYGKRALLYVVLEETMVLLVVIFGFVENHLINLSFEDFLTDSYAFFRDL